VATPIDNLPDDLESLKWLLAIERAARIDAEAKAARAAADVSSAEALIAHLKLAIEKMRRELYGSRSERGRKLLNQMELELEDLEAAATEDELAAEMAAAKTGGATTLVPEHARRKPVRKPFPAHLPRERVIVPGPTACVCCGPDFPS
jgi:transposase